jgi:hypothetical protein
MKSRTANPEMGALDAAISRRGVALGAAAAAFLPLASPSHAIEMYTSDILPPKAVEAYNKQWPTLQLAADYYAFELKPLVDDPAKWQVVSELGASKNIGSAASVSFLEREFFTPMRILVNSIPPDMNEEMNQAFNGFQIALAKLTRLARDGQITGDLPDASASEIAEVKKSWETGRESLNQFFVAMNTVTETDRMQTIPVGAEGYPRDSKRYKKLKKDLALCRNRGGELIAGIYGQLMVYGTTGVNPCGDLNLNNYFDK